jgi:hypothetical protein
MDADPIQRCVEPGRYQGIASIQTRALEQAACTLYGCILGRNVGNTLSPYITC